MMRTKVYVAAAWKRREDAARTAEALRAKYDIVSSWHDGPKDWEGVPTPERMQEIAIKDMKEVMYQADMLVALTDPPGAGQPYGSRHVEFGMAYAMDLSIMLIGPRELMFHHLPGVHQYENLEAFLKGEPNGRVLGR